MDLTGLEFNKRQLICHQVALGLWLISSLFCRTAGVTVLDASQCTGSNRQLGNGYCFFLPSPLQTVSASDARTVCSQQGGYLAGIYSDSDQTAVERLLSKNGLAEDVWTGARLENPENLVTSPQAMWRGVTDCATCGIDTTCSFTSTSSTVYTNPLDIAFVLDNSGSISDDDWTIVIEFMVKFVELLNIGRDGTGSQVAVAKFGNTAEVVFHLNVYTSKTTLLDKLRAIDHSLENTNTAAGIEITRKEIFSYYKGDRADVPNIMILFTDGKSTFSSERTIPEAQKSKDEAIVTFIIGVSGGVNVDEIRGMSDSPQTENQTYWLVPDFNTLSSMEIYLHVLNRVCQWNVRYQMMTKMAVDKQGCHDDSSDVRDLPNELSVDDLTPDKCITACKDRGYDYAGVQEGSRCFCGNEYGMYGTRTDCDTLCVGDSSQTCGGTRSSYVYYIPARREAIWAPGQPEILNSNTMCGAMDRSNSFRYATVSCLTQYRYNCRLPLSSCTNSPSDGTYQSIAAPYNFCLYTSSGKITWYRARQACLDRNGDLLSMDSSLLQSKVASALSNVNWGSDRYSLIGLYKRTYRWTQEESVKGGELLSYSRFSPAVTVGGSEIGQPNVVDGECVYMSPTQSYYWYSGQCTGTKKMFICQWPTAGSGPNPTTSTTGTTTVPGFTTTQGITGATPNVGASTDGGGLSATYIILIVVLVLLAIIILVIVIYFCVKNKEKGEVHPTKKNYERYRSDMNSPPSSTVDLRY